MTVKQPLQHVTLIFMKTDLWVLSKTLREEEKYTRELVGCSWSHRANCQHCRPSLRQSHPTCHTGACARHNMNYEWSSSRIHTTFSSGLRLRMSYCQARGNRHSLTGRQSPTPSLYSPTKASGRTIFCVRCSTISGNCLTNDLECCRCVCTQSVWLLAGVVGCCAFRGSELSGVNGPSTRNFV